MTKKVRVEPNDVPQPAPQAAGPTTSVFTVIGWLALTLAAVPLLMAAHGDGRIYLWSGLGTLVGGGVLLVIGHVRQNFD
ncbi:MAG TPA: hypothetical protein PKL08_11740 [Thermoanaerobaculaceae bacterium]|nr:hypothetical protein [Thermoanaerobaculaceae bacterium]